MPCGATLGSSMIDPMSLPNSGANSAPALTIIVPVYRSAKTLDPLHERTSRTLDRLNIPFEMLLIEDAGGDESWDVIRRIAARDGRVKGFRMGRNFGQHNALLFGIRQARGAAVVTIDDDLQHPPEEIPKLLARLEQGIDVVYGRPRSEKHAAWRNVASAVIKRILGRVMGIPNATEVSAFRVFRTRLRDGFVHFDHPYVNVDVLLSWSTNRFDSILVDHDPRLEGKSAYTVSKLIRHTLNLVTGFSVGPLRMASWLGFTAMLIGVAVLIYVLIVFVTVGRAVPGFAFTASITAIFSGTQLFALGIIGEYLARMHSSSLKRPVYWAAETTG